MIVIYFYFCPSYLYTIIIKLANEKGHNLNYCYVKKDRPYIKKDNYMVIKKLN